MSAENVSDASVSAAPLWRRFAGLFGLRRPGYRVQTRAPSVKARGFAVHGKRRIAVTCDQKLFDRIQAHADKEHVTFAEAVRRLIVRGLP